MPVPLTVALSVRSAYCILNRQYIFGTLFGGCGHFDINCIEKSTPDCLLWYNL